MRDKPKGARWKRWLKEILIVTILVTVASIGVDLWRSHSMPSDHAPELIAITLGNHSIDLNSMSSGQPVLLYFWGTWCPACKFVSPAVNWLSHHYPVMSIALHSGSDKRIQGYMTRHDYSFPVINDDQGMVSNPWGISATPTLVIVKDGKITSVTTGVTTPPGLWFRMLLAGM